MVLSFSLGGINAGGAVGVGAAISTFNRQLKTLGSGFGACPAGAWPPSIPDWSGRRVYEIHGYTGIMQ